MSSLHKSLGRHAHGLLPCGKAVPMPVAPRRACRGASFKTSAAAELATLEATPAAASAAEATGFFGGVVDPVKVDVPPTSAAATVAANVPDKPGLLDNQSFKQHWSVEFWRDFQVPETISDDATPLPSRLQTIVQTLTDAANSVGVFNSSQAALYWGYHITRSGFFAFQGIAGLMAAQAVSGITGNRSVEETGGRISQMLRNGLTFPIGEALAMYYQDYKNIQEGVYKLPWDMTTRGHRQFSPFWVARRSAQFVTEASATLKRRGVGKPEDVWLKSPLYPQYYLNTFHYQTDGWLSENSARVYETSTETLFIGRQDAMQRQTLVPLKEFMAERAASGRSTRVLEVAGGTGRFATFLKDNYPHADLTVLDLSPYYLQEARANMRYWADKRAPKGAGGADALGGPDGTGTSYLQAAAEDIPQPDASFDVVTCVYLFHELPPEVRRAAAAEMARVLKPGGLLVLTDSIQLGDRARIDANLVMFETFNEPYYRSFISEDFGKMFSEVGLECGTKILSSSSKTLSFRKPLAPKQPAQPPPVAAMTAPAVEAVVM